MLTGKDIHAAYMKTNDPNEAGWETLSTKRHAEYNDVAFRLNVSYIAPLQGWIRDFADLIDGDDLDLERIGEKRDALFERVRSLCGGQS